MPREKYFGDEENDVDLDAPYRKNKLKYATFT